MRRRDLLKAASVLATAPLASVPLAAPALAQAQKPLRFIPQANLTVLDPIWTTAVITYNHAYMVYDKLYGYDGAGQIKPQMAAGHEISQDELTWTFTLRDGLMFHDREPVRARDGGDVVAHGHLVGEHADERSTIARQLVHHLLTEGRGVARHETPQRL